MKDLEKIQSPDLACQVADANPGNFAIEQEVAAMVGATVPAPTAPSADDARELGAQLLVFLRRALLPIRSALRTALADIYDHLDSRCTDYTPAAYAPYHPLPSYDPMRPFVPRTLPNLLTAITAFSARKISNGSAPDDGIKDGTSLARLLCSSDASAVIEIADDSPAWVASRSNWLGNILATFPNASIITLNCSSMTGLMFTSSYSNDCEIHVKSKNLTSEQPYNVFLTKASLHYDELETCNFSNDNRPVTPAKRLLFHKFKSGVFRVAGSGQWNNSVTTYIYIGCKGGSTDVIRFWADSSSQAPNLTDIEIREGARQPLTLQNLNNLTAENIVNHIFEPLADNSDGDPITINIGSTNLAKLTDEQKAIAQNKNYTLA